MKIDIVYTWVNGSDLKWQEKKEACLNKQEKTISPTSKNKARFRDNQELMYSLRSIYKFAPWVNSIYIVTDNQIPEWFNPKNNWAKIVDHKDIFNDHSALPTFNSMAIESKLHNIDELAEHFLYFNDDVFLGKKSSPINFFNSSGIPRIFVSKILEYKPKKIHIKKARHNHKKNEFQASVENSRRFIYKKFDKYIKYRFRHGVKAIKKSDLITVSNLFKEELEYTSKQRFRTNKDVLIHALYSFYCLAKNKGVATYAPIINTKVRFLKNLWAKQSNYTYAYINLSKKDVHHKLELIKKHPHLMFCINEYENTPQENLSLVQNFFNDFLDIKSPAEK